MSSFPPDNNANIPAAPPIVASSMRCAQCGYDLTGAMIGGYCSECGLSVAETIRRQSIGLQSSGRATACMVVGILSIALCMILGPVAIVLYYKAMAQINTGGYSESSRTMAKAGLIMGIIGTCIGALYAIIFAIGISM
jgi:hypothetical protein